MKAVIENVAPSKNRKVRVGSLGLLPQRLLLVLRAGCLQQRYKLLLPETFFVRCKLRLRRRQTGKQFDFGCKRVVPAALLSAAVHTLRSRIQLRPPGAAKAKGKMSTAECARARPRQQVRR